MDIKDRPLIPTYCLFQGCYNPEYEKDIAVSKDLCWRYNALSPNDREGRGAILTRLIGKLGKDAEFVPPFWCDYGYRIEVGDNFYANHNTVMQDGGGITFGDNVFIAPGCVFTTAEHPLDPEQRKKGLEIAKPIKVGNNVWIGSNVTDIPSGVVAVGVPCRVMRRITEEDRDRYPVFDPESYGKK